MMPSPPWPLPAPCAVGPVPPCSRPARREGGPWPTQASNPPPSAPPSSPPPPLAASTRPSPSTPGLPAGDPRCGRAVPGHPRPGDHAQRIAAELWLPRPGDHHQHPACSSSANALMLGDRLLRHGLTDVAVVGGTDALCKFTVNGFNSLLILDREPCRPFDRDRAGLNLGEAAAYLVLETESRARARGAEVLAVVSGYANTNEAFHATASSPDGTGATRASAAGLAMAQLTPEAISYVNVHGNGTPNNDASEGIALNRLFHGAVPPFSSTKSFTGHTLGAAGAVEAVYAVLAIRHGVHFANLRWRTPLAEAPLVPVTRTRSDVAVRHVLSSSSFGFGGNNTSLVLSAPDARP
ncbi:MAG: hypothetical protein IPM68_14210 [Flavobacteriales bacterium]|nr:hypothetical protein [Flavobacteriales bacterium]